MYGCVIVATREAAAHESGTSNSSFDGLSSSAVTFLASGRAAWILSLGMLEKSSHVSG